MKIYALYHDESSEETVVCISENIEKIKEILSGMCKDRAFPHLEIWENGDVINSEYGNDALKLIANHNIELADVQKIFKENCKIKILEECKEYDTGIQEKSGTDKQYEENESR